MRGFVSVLMPVYNCAPYVREAVDSVLSQDYPDKELIVVDDGSTDETAEVLSSYGNRLRVLHQSNRGAAAARNLALAEARGDWVAFIDGDDVWLPGKLRAQTAYVRRHPETKLVYGSWAEWRPDTRGAWPDPLQFVNGYDDRSVDPSASGWIYSELLLDSIVCTITTMVSTELLKSVGGFDDTLRIGEDHDLWLRLARIVPMQKLSMMMALYRIRSQSTTRRPATENYGRRVLVSAIDRFGLAGPDGRSADARRVQQRLQDLSTAFGYHHLWQGDACIALNAFRQAHADGARSLRLSANVLLANLRCRVRRRSNKDYPLEVKQ